MLYTLLSKIIISKSKNFLIIFWVFSSDFPIIFEKYSIVIELRHTSISHMIEAGIPIQVISRKVSHSSLQVTDSIYSHFFDD